ncbi:10447_t:CDS:1, partial [Racocetra persica]
SNGSISIPYSESILETNKEFENLSINNFIPNSEPISEINEALQNL